MNVSKCLDLLLGRLGNRQADLTLRATCLDEMILAQETLLEGAPFIPWFCVSEVTSTTALANERRVLVPTDFIRDIDSAALYIVDDDGEEREMFKEDYDDLIAHFGYDKTSTLPRHYDLLGDYIQLVPIPSVDRTIRQKYFKKLTTPADLTTSENAWFKYAPDLIIAAVGEVVAKTPLKDEELAAYFEKMKSQAWDRLHRLVVAREEANRDRQMGVK